MARVPLLEQAFGQDRLARKHRLVGFTSFNLMLAHIVLITWGYAAGELGRTPATLWDLTSTTRACCWPRPAPSAWSWWWSPASRRRGAAALRVVAPAAPLRLPRRRAGPAAPAVDRAGVPRLAGGDRLLVGRSGRRAAGAVLVWRVALPLWRSARHGLRVTSVVPEGDGRRVGVHDRPAARPAAGARPGSSSTGASSPARAGPGPTPTRCRPHPTAAACGSPSRTSATAARASPAAAGHPGAGRGPLRPAERAGPDPPQGGAHRRRRRHHAAAGAGRGARLRAGEPSCSTASRPAAVRARVRRPRRGSAACRC